MPACEPTPPTHGPSTTPPAAPPSPADPPLIARITELEAALDAANAWDIAPQLFLWHPPVMAGLGIPTALWRRADNHPAVILQHLTEDWDNIRASLIEQDPVVFAAPPQAVVLASEGWAFDMLAVQHDPLKIAEYERVAATRRIHAHPDRIEMRTVTAVHVNGAHIMVTRMRGQAATVHTEPIDGMITECLGAFLAAITTPAEVSPE